MQQLNAAAYCVLIDEAQFLQKHHVFECARVVDELHIPVIAFGLKNDFKNELFEGSRYLLLYADKIEEMKTICWFCAKKATMNLRVHDASRCMPVNRCKSAATKVTSRCAATTTTSRRPSWHKETRWTRFLNN